MAHTASTTCVASFNDQCIGLGNGLTHANAMKGGLLLVIGFARVGVNPAPQLDAGV